MEEADRLCAKAAAVLAPICEDELNVRADLVWDDERSCGFGVDLRWPEARLRVLLRIAYGEGASRGQLEAALRESDGWQVAAMLGASMSIDVGRFLGAQLGGHLCDDAGAATNSYFSLWLTRGAWHKIAAAMELARRRAAD
jgi:hypothetical protein